MIDNVPWSQISDCDISMNPEKNQLFDKSAEQRAIFSMSDENIKEVSWQFQQREQLPLLSFRRQKAVFSVNILEIQYAANIRIPGSQ
jgi:hypothetical protein